MNVEIKVLFFARLSELAQSKEQNITMESGSTVDDLFTMLCSIHPELSDYEDRLMFAVNAEYVDKDHVLQAGSELALIPPVSGG